MDQTMEELKPCPFCGYAADRVRSDNGVSDIVCSGCGARGPVRDTRQVYGNSLRASLWNFRINKGLIRPKPEPRYDKAYFDFVENLNKNG